jgi:PHD/YefM family antitoxin component YafN of YafNO toxin-antitoxin module
MFPDFLDHAFKNVENMNTCKNNNKAKHLLQRHKKGLLNLEISECTNTINNLKNSKNIIERKLKNILPESTFQNLQRTQDEFMKNNIDKTSTKLKNKFTKISEKYTPEIEIRYDKECIKNLTEYEIPEPVQMLLSYGPKFNLPTDEQNFPVKDFIADLEIIFEDITDWEKKEILRDDCVQIIKKHIKQKPSARIDKIISKALKATKRFIKEHRDIVILSSDKGNKTVIMKREEYDRKMNELLEDQSTYERIDEDETKKLQSKNNRLVKKLEDAHSINKFKAKKLKTSIAICPKIYGAPKIHKEDIPLRPIVSTINSPCYELSKYMAAILNKITRKSAYSVRNSIEFKEFIDKVNLNKDDNIFSLDVTSLFTKVDKDLAIQAIKENWSEIEQHTPIEQKTFIKLITFCTKECNIFQYNNQYYKQKFGLFMGNPLSGTLADLTLDTIIDKALKKTKQKKIDITFIKKYVDDLCLASKKEDIDKVKDTFNSVNKDIQFTIEKEKSQSVPFLNMEVIRYGRKIKTNWYCKESSSNRILNFLSLHPYKTKYNVAKAFAKTMLDVSDKIFKNENLFKIRHILKKNNYPTNIIEKIIKETHFIKKKQATNTNNEIRIEVEDTNNVVLIAGTKPIYKTIPYIPRVSENIKNKILRTNKEAKISYRPQNKMQQHYSKMKDKPKTMERSKVIYKVDCECGKDYIGQTGRKLSTRIDEHKKYIEKKTPKSGLAAHALTDSHVFNFDTPTILATERVKKKRETKESLLIYKNRDKSVNIKRDTDNIKRVYRQLVNNTKHI